MLNSEVFITNKTYIFEWEKICLVVFIQSQRGYFIFNNEQNVVMCLKLFI